jgi:hypothetical protein
MTSFTIKNNNKEKKDKVKSDEVKSDEVKKNEVINNIDNKNISLLNSLRENYQSYLCIILSIFILSYENFFLGIITFFIIIYLSYSEHKNAHIDKNIFTIIHFYHHENNNFFSHFIQILLELTTVGIFTPLYYIFGTIFLNPWVLIFFILFYSSVHNINYSIFHINNVHKLHHQFIQTNIGPDILDIIFETKNPIEKQVENTNHYIPNIILSTFIVLIIKYFWNNNNNKKYMLLILNIFLIISFFILITSSIYLWNINKK